MPAIHLVTSSMVATPWSSMRSLGMRITVLPDTVGSPTPAMLPHTSPICPVQAPVVGANAYFWFGEKPALCANMLLTVIPAQAELISPSLVLHGSRPRLGRMNGG